MNIYFYNKVTNKEKTFRNVKCFNDFILCELWEKRETDILGERVI